MEITFSKDGRHYLTERQVKAEKPNTGFPAGFDLTTLGYEQILPVIAPTFDPITQIVRRVDPVRRDDGRLIEAWEVVALDAETVAANQARAKQQLITSVTQATQQRLDDFARQRNYDGILSACTYATSAVPKFAAEGQYCVTARDATWATLYAIMAEIEAGARTMPTGYSSIELDLPPLVWPT